MPDDERTRRPDSWFPLRQVLGPCADPPHGEDVERALTAAERLLTQGQEEARHLQTMRFGAVSLLIVTLLSISGLIVGFVQYEAAGLLVIAFVLGTPVALWLLRLAVRPTPTLSTELAAEIAAMVNELLIDTATREGWSHLRVEAMRLRLSRFPLADRRAASTSKLADVEQLFSDEE